MTSCGKLKVIPSTEPLFTRKLDVLEVIEGRNARFDCKVSGTPPPKVVWSHFGEACCIQTVCLTRLIKHPHDVIDSFLGLDLLSQETASDRTDSGVSTAGSDQ